MYRNVTHLYNKLKEEGYKISKAKIYKDKDKQVLRANADGTIDQISADNYKLLLDKKEKEGNDILSQRKLELQLKELQEKVRKLQDERFVREDSLIQKDKVESYIIGRYMFMHSYLTSTLSSRIREIRNLQSDSEAIEAVHIIVNDMFNSLAKERTFELELE